ncbi:hypothetical protein LDENG_00123690 [Lucifuga dentata]|nr:hypothetical protein LDENG_00123690 [Lucifuga dentata]
MVQNTAAQLLTWSNRRTHITPILSSLHWFPINFRFHFKILILSFRALHFAASQYVIDLLQPHRTSQPLGSSGHRLLRVLSTHFKTCGDGAFQAVYIPINVNENKV